jgi:hypothetical protein
MRKFGDRPGGKRGRKAIFREQEPYIKYAQFL